MTTCIFGATAPITPSTSCSQETDNLRIARGAWLVARLVRQEPVRRKDFQERFGRLGRGFCCEVAALRAAGIYRGSDLLHSPTRKRQREGAAR